MKILTIGNSFSDNATSQLNEMVAAVPDVKLAVGRASLGGCSLEKHWNLVEQCDLLPDVKPYEFAILSETSQPMTLREALQYEKWDYITLQQVSHCSWRLETFSPYIERLYDLIKTLAPSAEIVLHQTWAYRVDDNAYFSENNLTQQIMQQKICDNYSTIGERLHCRIIPVGEAIQQVRDQLKFSSDQSFDYENAQPRQLPDESNSLSEGYMWKTGNTPSGKAELVADYRHLNYKGCYVANAVWFELFTGKSILDNPFRPDNIPDEQLELFKTIAHQTVKEHGGSWV